MSYKLIIRPLPIAMLLIGMIFMLAVNAASAYTPNDPYWGNQWGPGKIYLPQAWDYQKGSTSITVAILDTGIDYNHADLAGRVIQGWNTYNNSNFIMDDNSGSHGTHVAGIAGAIMGNYKGVAGTAQTKLLAVKTNNFMGLNTYNSIKDGIIYAANNNAKIISMSFGKTNYSSVVEQAVNYAYNTKGALLVAAAGEAYIGDGIEFIEYPANFANVIAVGATDSSDQRAHFSNYGSKLELVAPGVNIYSTTRNNGYGYKDGQSMSVPFISGVAALIWSQNPSFSNNKVREVLRNTAYDLGTPGKDIYYGYGKVNAYAAVTRGKPVSTPRSGTLSGSGTSSTPYSVSIPAPSTVNVVMAGNENSDFDLYAKWGSPPTTSSYDAKGYSSYSLEYFPIKGSGTLYVMVRSYSGSGNWKSWVIGGLYFDNGKKQGTLSGTGADSASYPISGDGIGYAFNSGPDGSNFDLYTKWYSPPTTSSYNAVGNSPGAQEIAGPTTGNGTNYFRVHSTSGSGEYVTAGMVY